MLKFNALANGLSRVEQKPGGKEDESAQAWGAPNGFPLHPLLP